MRIALWEFPAADFPDWLALVGESDCRSYADYLAMLAAVQADQEGKGIEVVRVKMTVAQMRAGLAERGLNNTAANRATITAAWPWFRAN